MALYVSRGFKAMYITLILLPGLSSIICGLFGRKLGINGANLISITIMIVTSILTLVAFYEVVVCNNPVYIYLGTWVSTDYLQGDWAFCFDSLTCSILLAVVLVSTMVHLFSIDYMAGDPHTPRFISYLGIFTFFMVVLVTGDSYLVLFLGYF